MPEPVSRENLRKQRVGVVVSDKMQKTIVVRIHQSSRHPLYGKVMEGAKKFKVHDEKNEAKVGDRVRIGETRPLSKDKCWRLIEIIGHDATKSSADMKEVKGTES